MTEVPVTIMSTWHLLARGGGAGQSVFGLKPDQAIDLTGASRVTERVAGRSSGGNFGHYPRAQGRLPVVRLPDGLRSGDDDL